MSLVSSRLPSLPPARPHSVGNKINYRVEFSLDSYPCPYAPAQIRARFIHKFQIFYSASKAGELVTWLMEGTSYFSVAGDFDWNYLTILPRAQSLLSGSLTPARAYSFYLVLR